MNYHQIMYDLLSSDRKNVCDRNRDDYKLRQSKTNATEYMIGKIAIRIWKNHIETQYREQFKK